VPVKPPQPGRRYKPATVRFYFDADVLGVAHVIAGLRPDATYPGDPGGVVRRLLRPPCLVADPATKDSTWIPIVAERGWLIVTRDSKSQSIVRRSAQCGSTALGWSHWVVERPRGRSSSWRC
jgi:hypothetical protein